MDKKESFTLCVIFFAAFTLIVVVFTVKITAVSEIWKILSCVCRSFLDHVFVNSTFSISAAPEANLVVRL